MNFIFHSRFRYYFCSRETQIPFDRVNMLYKCDNDDSAPRLELELVFHAHLRHRCKHGRVDCAAGDSDPPTRKHRHQKARAGRLLWRTCSCEAAAAQPRRTLGLSWGWLLQTNAAGVTSSILNRFPVAKQATHCLARSGWAPSGRAQRRRPALRGRPAGWGQTARERGGEGGGALRRECHAS